MRRNSDGTESGFEPNEGKNIVGPNKVCPIVTLDAADPADVATYNTIVTAFEEYDDTKNAFRTNLKAQLLSDGYTEKQIEGFENGAN